MAGQIRAAVTFTNNLDGMIANILTGTVLGQNLAGERLLAMSAEQVPWAEGTLGGKGTVVHAKNIGDETLVVYDEVYAARWHEDGEFVDNLGRHYMGNSTFQGGRKSHYLSDPALQNTDELRDKIGTEAKRGAK